MELQEALQQISDIRGQMARGSVFRGYRSATVAFSGVLAISAACFQPHVASETGPLIWRYIGWWTCVAAISVAVVAVELIWRTLASESGLSRQMTRSAVLQFCPCLMVGALMTLVIGRDAPQVGWMLPGLWALIFSTGVLGSLRLMPKPVVWVGVFYALAGLACLRFGQQENVFSPWLMGITFGGGQLLSAAVLYWNLERGDGCEQA